MMYLKLQLYFRGIKAIANCIIYEWEVNTIELISVLDSN